MSTLHRAFSVLEIKSIDEDKRILEGVATTPSTDRVGDIVDPKGAIFKLPLPFMWQHGKDPFVGQTPVGNVVSAKVTADGIPVRIQMERSDQPGRLKDILDFAWEVVKKRLVRGLSIGFNAVEVSDISGSFGQRFIKWEWLELSGVTIAANAGAEIITVKSIVDAAHLAATGNGDRPITPGVSGTPAGKPVRASMKTITEQLKDFDATRAGKSARMNELMNGAAEKGETLDEAQSQEYDTLETEVKAIDAHMARLSTLEKANQAAAKPVDGETIEKAAAARSPQPVITVRDNMPPGIAFARKVMCQVQARLDSVNVADVAKQRYPDHAALHDSFVAKAAVPAGTTTETVWAGPLVYANTLESEFIEFLRPMTILGKFGTGGVPSLRRVPFNVRFASQTSGGTGYWVGQGAPKPLTSFAFSATTLGYTKVAAISVITEELARFSTPSAETLVRDALAGALIERIDIDFIDPDSAAVTNVQPASITSGLMALSSAGTSADNVRTDLGKIIGAFVAANLSTASLVLIMPNSLALVLSIMVNSLGQPEFPGLTSNGGSLNGIPVITSQYAANSSGAGNLVIAVAASELFLADDGQVRVDASREASLQMLDNPTNNSATATATTMVSMYQTNSIALRAERFINWAKRRSDAVVYMDDVNWGSVGSPA